MKSISPGWCLGAALALALLELGCGHTEARRVAFEPSANAGDVAIFASQPPPGGHELGQVVVRGGGGVAGDDVRALYSELVRQTQALGGNALVIESIKTGIKDGDRSCGLDCTDDTPPQAELRGKALLLPPEELKPAPRSMP